MRARFVRCEHLGADMYTFWFEPEHRVRYIAGQFTELYLPHESADGRGQRRWFSLSSSPTDPLLSITTRLPEGKRSTFKQQLSELRSGTELNFADPMGDFVLPKNPTLPLVFAAAGMGIAPVHSIIKYLAATGERRNIRLVQVVHSPNEFIFNETFAGLPHAQLASTRNERLTAKRLLTLANAAADTLLYISGPELLVETLVRELTHAGLAPERIIADYFPGYIQ
ncbi:MAG TPA: FAD-dependent oxidoreductase [Candidatus Saccharimonadales bacterium]|nr:FAD-dependent oxidoreductase [Candidatus Saccharimonadales bacterium]